MNDLGNDSNAPKILMRDNIQKKKKSMPTKAKKK
jgi:hypothetical protein